MHFLIDANLPVALARWIMARPGQTSNHLDDLGSLQLADEAIFRLAGARDWVIVTKDADFTRLHIRGLTAPRVIWLRTANARKHETVGCLALHWSAIEQALSEGARIIELRERSMAVIG